MCKSKKQLIILRPLKSSKENLRLGLYTDDFNQIVSNQVSSLYVDLGDGREKVQYLTAYINYGSIVGKGLINGWLQRKGFLLCEQQLLFELEINDDEHTHIYRYIGAIIK